MSHTFSASARATAAGFLFVGMGKPSGPAGRFENEKLYFDEKTDGGKDNEFSPMAFKCIEYVDWKISRSPTIDLVVEQELEANQDAASGAEKKTKKRKMSNARAAAAQRSAGNETKSPAQRAKSKQNEAPSAKKKT